MIVIAIMGLIRSRKMLLLTSPRAKKRNGKIQSLLDMCTHVYILVVDVIFHPLFRCNILTHSPGSRPALQKSAEKLSTSRSPLEFLVNDVFFPPSTESGFENDQTSQLTAKRTRLEWNTGPDQVGWLASEYLSISPQKTFLPFNKRKGDTNTKDQGRRGEGNGKSARRWRDT